MGKVMEQLKLINLYDQQNALAGTLPADRVRSVTVEALVDTGATMLVLPADVVAALGLPIAGTRRVRYADGRAGAIPWVRGVSLELLGREMSCDALVEAAGTTPLIGQIPLEELDLIVDPKNKSLAVNPESPDMPLLDLLRVAAEPEAYPA
jgi:clan AA aspartic protease